MNRFMKHACVVVSLSGSSLSCSDQITIQARQRTTTKTIYLNPSPRNETCLPDHDSPHFCESQHYPKPSLTPSASHDSDNLEFGRLTAEKIAAQEARDQAIEQRNRSLVQKNDLLQELDHMLYALMRLNYIFGRVTTEKNKTIRAISIEHGRSILDRDRAVEQKKQLAHTCETLRTTLSAVTQEKDAALQKIALLEAARNKVLQATAREHCRWAKMYTTWPTAQSLQIAYAKPRDARAPAKLPTIASLATTHTTTTTPLTAATPSIKTTTTIASYPPATCSSALSKTVASTRSTAHTTTTATTSASIVASLTNRIEKKADTQKLEEKAPRKPRHRERPRRATTSLPSTRSSDKNRANNKEWRKREE